MIAGRPLSRAITWGRRAARRALAAAGAVRPADSGRHRIVLPNGRSMVVDLADGRAAKLRATSGNANPPSLAAWVDLLESRRWDVVLDIGSNYGEMLVNADLSGHGIVVAIEPNPAVASCLIETVALNELAIHVCTAVLGDGHGVVALDSSGPNSGAAAVGPVQAPPPGRPAPLLAASTTVDGLLDALGISVGTSAIAMKIDVEGHEDAVLRGARRVLADAAHIAVMTEVLHGEWIPDGFEVTTRIASQSQPKLVQDVILTRSATLEAEAVDAIKAVEPAGDVETGEPARADDDGRSQP